MATSIGSIYVAVKGDDTQFKKDMTALRSTAKKSGVEVSNALNNAISPKKASSGIAAISTGLSQLSKAAKVPESQFKQTASAISKGFSGVAKSIGMTEKEFVSLNEKMLRNKAMQQTESSLRSITRNAGLSAKETRNLAVQMGYSAKEANRMANSIHRTGESASKLSSALKQLAGQVAALLTLRAVGQELSKIIEEGEKLQRNMLRTEQMVKSTGMAAGFTAQQLHEQARQLALGTLQSTEGVMEAQQVLMSFKKVSGETFIRATELAADLATVTKKDLKSSINQLGKALEDPVKGITALTRSGVSFTDQQKETVKSLVESNRILEAQTLILDELAGQYGGVAKAEAQGLAGAQDTLAQAMQEARQAIYESANAGETLAGVLNRISTAIFEITQDGSLDFWVKNLTTAFGKFMDVASTTGKFLEFLAGGDRDPVRIIGEDIDKARAKVVELHSFIKKMELMPKDQRERVYGSGIEEIIERDKAALLVWKSELNRLKIVQEDIIQPPEDLAKIYQDEFDAIVKSMNAVPEATKKTSTDVGAVTKKEIESAAKAAKEEAEVYQRQFDATKNAYVKSLEDQEKARIKLLESNIKSAEDEAKVYQQQFDVTKEAYVSGLKEIDDEEKQIEAAFQQLQSAWAGTVSSMIMNAESFGDVWSGVVGIMQQNFSASISKMAVEYAKTQMGMGAISSGIAGGLAGGLAGMAVGAIGSQVAGMISGGSGPSELSLSLERLRESVDTNSEKLEMRNRMESGISDYEAAIAGIESLRQEAFSGNAFSQLNKVAELNDSSGKISEIQKTAIETLFKQTGEVVKSIQESISGVTQTGLEGDLESVRKKWYAIIDEAKLVDQVNADYAGGSTSLANEAQAAFDTELQALKDAALKNIQGIYSEAAQMAQPLSASEQALNAISDRFDSMRESLRGLGEAVDDTALAADEMAVKQRAIAAMYQGLFDQIGSSRRSTWGQDQWKSEQTRLMDSLVSLDSSSSTYHDDSLSLMTKIWEANQQANEIQTQTAANTASMASSIMKLVSYDEARMGIDKLLESLSGGDLAASQSKEFFDNQYQAKLGAITDPNNTPEQAVAAVQEFSSFLPQFLSFMNAYGLDYAGLTSMAMSDLSAAKSGLKEDYYIAEASGGGGSYSIDTTGLEEVLTQGFTVNFVTSDTLSNEAATLLKLLDMTFAADGTMTPMTEPFTIKMAADLGREGDSGTALEILETLNGNAITKPLTVPFLVSFARNAQPEEVMNMLDELASDEKYNALTVPFIVSFLDSTGPMSNAEIADFLRELDAPGGMIRDILVGLNLDSQSISDIEAALSGIAPPTIPIYFNLAQESIDAASMALSSIGLGDVGLGVGLLGDTIMGGLGGLIGEFIDQVADIPIEAFRDLAAMQGANFPYTGNDLQYFALNNPALISEWMEKNQTWNPMAYATGGIINSPTMALMGEGSYNEAVVPLPNGRSIPVAWVGSGGNSASDNKKIESLLTRLVNAVESGRDVTIRVEPDEKRFVRLIADEMQSGNQVLARGVRKIQN